MKITVSVIKADIGSIGGHIKPSQKLKETVSNYINDHGVTSKEIINYRVSSTGDDIAMLMTHEKSTLNEKIHKLAWDAFLEGATVAKEQGLYGAGQDLLKDAFSGNVKGMGPAVAEMEIEERPNECFVAFAADKTDPKAYNLPFYLAFADPMYCAGLPLSPKMAKGSEFVIMGVAHTEGDRVFELSAPQDLYDIASLLRDNQRFVIDHIYSNSAGEIAASISTTQLHNIAGKYTGKDDPIALMRVQRSFLATGEVLAPFSIAQYVSGFIPASQTGPLVSIKANSPFPYSDEAWSVAAQVSFMTHQQCTCTTEMFNQTFWEGYYEQLSGKAREDSPKDLAKCPLCHFNFKKMYRRMRKFDRELQKLRKHCQENKRQIDALNNKTFGLKDKISWIIVKVVLWILTAIFLLANLMRD